MLLRLRSHHVRMRGASCLQWLVEALTQTIGSLGLIRLRHHLIGMEICRARHHLRRMAHLSARTLQSSCLNLRLR